MAFSVNQRHADRIWVKLIGIFSGLFSLFSIVQFQNDECTSVSSSTTLGTCFTSSECSAKSGTASGNCAAGMDFLFLTVMLGLIENY